MPCLFFVNWKAPKACAHQAEIQYAMALSTIATGPSKRETVQKIVSEKFNGIFSSLPLATVLQCKGQKPLNFQPGVSKELRTGFFGSRAPSSFAVKSATALVSLACLEKSSPETFDKRCGCFSTPENIFRCLSLLLEVLFGTSRKKSRAELKRRTAV